MRLNVTAAWLLFAASAYSGADRAPTVAPALARPITFAEARPILEDSPDSLSAELRSGLAPARWPVYVLQRDRDVRDRLARGEEDSLANLLMFGTAFTRAPRLTPDWLAGIEGKSRRDGPAAAEADLSRVFDLRVGDLAGALLAPTTNERLRFMQELVRRKGYSLQDPAGREPLRRYLLLNLQRVRKEYAEYAAELAAARAHHDSTHELVVRSRLFRNRGIALDTSVVLGLAIEESLQALRAEGALTGRSVRRVAVVGPGLDFVDKSEGRDFYPPQTVQPLALVDSLRRLGLAALEGVEVTTFDISPRVNEHLRRAQARARSGYVLQLPRDPAARWTPAALGYWERLGDRIGTPATPVVAPSGEGPVVVRAVAVRPEVVAKVRPLDLNVVWQRLDLPASETFDLVLATNILVYYGDLEQGLAVANLEAMLRPGGVLLSNNAVRERPASRMRSIGYKTVVYSDRPDDGDHIVFYQRRP